MSGRQGALDAIDFAVDALGIESFASLDNAPDTYGEHAFYAIEKPSVRAGVLADVRTTRRPRDQLLNVIERAAEHPGMRVLDGDALTRETITEIGTVDAVLLIDVLLHTVDPDWDRLLQLWAPATSCFVIVNPQWRQGEETIRLIDLGREGFARAVPPYPSHRQLFDRLEEWYPAQHRPVRDARFVWQWGITDADLEAQLAQLGFSRDYERDLGAFPGADAFIDKAFVFSRPELGRRRDKAAVTVDSPAYGDRPPRTAGRRARAALHLLGRGRDRRRRRGRRVDP